MGIDQDREIRMVTVAELAKEAGKNASTIRGRILRARKMGIVKWERQGKGTILVDKKQGLKIARSVGKHLNQL